LALTCQPFIDLWEKALPTGFSTNAMKVERAIMSRVAELLEQDGFRQPTRDIFVKDWNENWRGWLAVDAGSHLLGPRVGIFSEELENIHASTLRKTGGVWKKRKDGPPLIMINLQQLAENDPDCSQRMTWRYTGEELKQSVAEDVVYCFRKKAYPYIDAHVTYQSILDAAMAGRASPAFQHFLPIILIKLRRFDDLMTYVAGRKSHLRDNEEVTNFQRYVDALLEGQQGGGE
jgi:hypothetical protein